MEVSTHVFGKWSELPYYLKIHILKTLSYPTLRNFMVVSKECLELASAIVTEAFSVYLRDLNYVRDEDDEENEYNNIRDGSAVELSVWYIPPHLKNVPNSFEPYRLLFSNDGNGGCTLKKIKEETQNKCFGKEVCYAEETAFAVALRSFFQLTRNIKAKELAVEIVRMDSDLECALKQQTSSNFRCKSFLIRTEDRTLPPLLYPFIPVGTSLKIYTSPFPEPNDIFIESSSMDLELMRAAPYFDTEANVGVTNEQLPCLRGHTMRMKAPFISSEGVNDTLMQWFEGKRKVIEIILNQTQKLDNDEVLKGLEDHVLSESELRDAIGARLDSVRGPNLFGVRNRLGQVMVVSLGPNSFGLIDPYYEEDDC